MDSMDSSIYFCGSIRGGRVDQKLYYDLITYMQSFGVVLTAHVGEKDLETNHNLSRKEIYVRDMKWMAEADYVIAEVSTPSLGVGFEISRAVSLNKKILCLSQKERNDKLSAIISGCSDLQIMVYSDIDQARSAINHFLD